MNKVKIRKTTERDLYDIPDSSQPEVDYIFNVKSFDLSIDKERGEYCRLRNSEIDIQHRTDIICDGKLIIWLEYWEPDKKKEAE